MKGMWSRLALCLGCILSSADTGLGQDTLRIDTGDRPRWGADLRLELQVRVGRALDGSEEESFGLIGGVVVGPRGRVFVADLMVPAIRVFDADGTRRASVGRRGAGPGEFSELRGLQPPGARGVAAWDPGRQRVSRFDLDGHFLDSFPVRSALLTADALRVDSAGRYYVRAYGPPTPGSERTSRPAVWLRHGADGALLDTLAVPPPDRVGPVIARMSGAGPLRAFPVETRSAISPHGYRVDGRTDSLAFLRPLGDGRTVRVGRKVDPVDVRAEERAQWQALLDEAARRSGRDTAERVPTRKPAFRDLWVDSDGRVWLWRYVEAGRVGDDGAARTGGPPIDWREAPTWDVFDPRGELLGTVILPRESRPAAARGRDVWVVETGPHGEQYVARYRIVPG